MSEQARQERSAASALQELGRAHQQTKHEVQQRWGGDISGGNLKEQLRPIGHRCVLQSLLVIGSHDGVEPLGMAQLLQKKGMEIFPSQLLKE